MDNLWERSIPLYKISINDIKKIFINYDKNIKVLCHKEINAGCRNSNYLILTDKGPYFFRISPGNGEGAMNEKAAFDALKDKINLPKLYFLGKFQGKTYLIYEYINASSLQTVYPKLLPYTPKIQIKVGLKNGLKPRIFKEDHSKNFKFHIVEPFCKDKLNRISDEIIRKVAKIAATLHNLKRDDVVGLNELNLPPFKSWYHLFLSNENTSKRLGQEVVNRVRKLIECKDKDLFKIDSYKSFVHSDFRPCNMLIDVKNEIYLTDFEFATIGHILGDIGQFFRYGEYFDKEHLEVFEEEYNKFAIRRLPEDWYDLSLLRDLVNPLQMLGEPEEKPEKYKDLKDVILSTLEYFGY